MNSLNRGKVYVHTVGDNEGFPKLRFLAAAKARFEGRPELYDCISDISISVVRPYLSVTRSSLSGMDALRSVATIINKLLSRNPSAPFNSAWILKRAPQCYGLIRKHIRSDVGGIDWDRITYALEPKYQRLWRPQRKRKSRPYRNSREIDLILNRYRHKLYVFVAPAGAADFRIRDQIAISLVRVAQAGNVLAKAKVVELVDYTIAGWLDNHGYISRWRGRDDDIRDQLEGCIRRYRYSGSFLRYVFRTLEYAGRGIRALQACSLDEPIATNSGQRRIDSVIHDPETNTVGFYKPRRAWSFDAETQLNG